MHRNILRTLNIQFVQKRFFKRDQVRVRFAPSPTGLMHLGGLRTALYNYLFARANNGTFILRIEDTDQTRCVPEAIEKIQNDLLWSGIISDEDPIRGGPSGPYIQSKRLEIYKEQVLKLLSNQSAYYCFCTESRMQLLRREALKCRHVPKYDNRCRHLSKDEVKEKLDKNHPYCIRFKLSSVPEHVDDIIYGKIVHDIAQTEGDPVIIKADGYPTYHFANVVDDHLMEISHVLRGIEWQISTPKHIMMYKAFNWTPPVYGHLPLILNSNGTKLSKRQNDVQIESLRKDGIFPLAVLNYIIHAGGGFDNKGGAEYIQSYEELIKQFDVSKIKVNSNKLLPEKLLQFNKLEISKLIANDKNKKFLVERIRRLVIEAFPDRKNNAGLQLDEHHIMTVLKWGQDRIYKLSDLVTPNFAFLWVIPSSPVNVTESGCLDVLKIINMKLSETDSQNYNKTSINSYLKELANEHKIPIATLMTLLRGILSGLKEGPPVGEMMEILGKDTTLLRINRFIS
ncbi:probable glutamate--tRNA ligase, mitochondrial isoform X1 [Colletes gigas]|uniref:probable glutamate--tRNA ligase, mitochondrial isoform X1 n=1 Tax=Colletes gigas TaxID=935657 RepID=UPI001C9A4D34|nr:probable glutamate--tRNA ligase, mitochondrial isoform X1 [Colletes gigas]XP_043262904.1 probable glutamate--tRNA ligase, mitochondrial isoform X1 [Colletes gigas]